MAFKPKNQSNNNSNSQNDNPGGLFPVPKDGSRKARISLIVDLGTQERDDLWELDGKAVPEGTEGAVAKSQKPCQQLAVFADLTADNVDYGGTIGKQHYRLLLNKSFGGNIQGINFTAVPPMDANGKRINGKPWGFHPQNLLTKIAKATGKPEVIESTDVEQLLNMPFMAQVEVKVTESDKVDNDGKKIVYKNVNFKGASPVPSVETGEDDEDGNPIEAPMPVPELKVEAKCITFDNATADDIIFIRKKLLNMIKQSSDYAGSNMQKAVEEFEARGNQPEEAEEEQEEAPKQVKQSAKKPAVKIVTEDESDLVPF